MSSPVSPRQRDIGEVASLRAEGVDPTAAKRLPCKVESRKVCEAAMLILSEPLRHSAPPPLSAHSAAGEDIATHQPRHAISCQTIHIRRVNRGGHCYASAAKLKNVRQIPSIIHYRTPPALRATSPIRGYCAAEENIATYPLSTAHNYTLTGNTPYRSNRRGGQHYYGSQPRTHKLHSAFAYLHRLLNPQL